MIPEDLCLTAEALAQVKRLCQWAERQVAELEQVTQDVEAQLQPSPPLVPTVAAAAFVSPPHVTAAAPVPVVPVPVRVLLAQLQFFGFGDTPVLTRYSGTCVCRAPASRALLWMHL